MKILYVTNMYPSSGRLYDGIFIKEQIEYYEKKYNLQYKVYLINGMESKLNYLKSIFVINSLVNKEKFDLIHIHFGLSGIFLLFNPFINIPTVLTLHGSDIQSYKKDGVIQFITRLVARRAKRIIILNDKMRNILKKHQYKLVKIPCGIDTRVFDFNRSNIHNESFTIGFPSDKRRAVKNYSLFQRIIENLNNQGYQIKTIEFKDFTREQVAFNLSKLDCLLMTSLSEGSPQIIKEAMVCEVPIVSSKVGDVEFLLKGVKNCFVVNSFEVEVFTAKIINLINLKPVERRTNGKQKIKLLGLDQTSVCSKLFNVYENILIN